MYASQFHNEKCNLRVIQEGSLGISFDKIWTI